MQFSHAGIIQRERTTSRAEAALSDIRVGGGPEALLSSGFALEVDRLNFIEARSHQRTVLH